MLFIQLCKFLGRIGILFTIYLPVFAGDLNHIGHFTNENGLSNNSITCIFQDRNKSIWIGTSDGLNLYNGFSFRIYRNIRGDSSSLPDNGISTIFQDSKGNLWIGTQNGGICRYDPKTNAFIRVPINENGISNSNVTDIVEDKYGYLWIATNWGLNRYNYLTGKINQFLTSYSLSDLQLLVTLKQKELPKELKEKLDSISLIRSYIDEDDLFDLLEKNYGTLSAKSIQTLIVQNVGIKQSKIILDCNVRSICTSENGNLWIGYEHGGISQINPKTLLFEHFPHLKNSSNSPLLSGISRIYSIQNEVYLGYNDGEIDILDIQSLNFIHDNKFKLKSHISNFVSYGKNNFLIGSEDEIKLINTTNNTSESFLNQPEFKDIPDGKSISYIYIDNQNNRWIGTTTSGLYLINVPKGFHILDNKNVLSKNGVTALYQDRKQNIWVGYSPEGLDRFTPSWRKVKSYQLASKEKSQTFNKPALAIYEDKMASFWVCTYQKGIFKYNSSSDQFTNLRTDLTDPEQLIPDDFRSLADDGKGHVWFASQGLGMCMYDQNAKKFQKFKADYTNWQNHLPTAWLFDIAIDKNGLFWIGTSEGLCIYNPSTNIYSTLRSTNSQLVNDIINVIYIDSFNNIWIGTKGGLSIYEQSAKKFYTLTIESGIPNNDIKAILATNNQSFWISTNGGIFNCKAYQNGRIDQSLLRSSIHKFDVYDGISSNEFFDRSCLKDTEGRLYFGGNTGITTFHPDSIVLNNKIPEIIFTEFKLFNNPVIINQKYGGSIVLNRPLISTDTIYLSHFQNMISFEFVALNYIQPHKNLYKYRLSGFDSTWINIGNKNEITYTNLRPGKYILTILGCNNDGFWNMKGKSLTIIIYPPFWNTIWFRIITIVFVIFLITGIYYLRLTRIRSVNAELRKAVIKGTRELVEKNRILMEQAEELNSINSLLEEGKQQIEQQAEELTQQRDELGHLNITKDKLFSILAHDLKNPFNSIIGFSDLLLMGIDKLKQEEIVFYTEIIRSSSITGNELLENIMQWSGCQTGRILFEQENLILHEIIEETIDLFVGNLHRKKITATNFVNSGQMVFADRNMVKTIFRNLISNAIKFTPQNGRIEISSIVNANLSEVLVTDNGIGISPENIDKIFQLETNYSTKGTENEPGTGLGLILCKEFVEIHKGNIWVISNKGKGVSFHFTLPTVK